MFNFRAIYILFASLAIQQIVDHPDTGELISRFIDALVAAGQSATSGDGDQFPRRI
jgi:hypothetical protein